VQVRIVVGVTSSGSRWMGRAGDNAGLRWLSHGNCSWELHMTARHLATADLSDANAGVRWRVSGLRKKISPSVADPYNSMSWSIPGPEGDGGSRTIQSVDPCRHTRQWWCDCADRCSGDLGGSICRNNRRRHSRLTCPGRFQLVLTGTIVAMMKQNKVRMRRGSNVNVRRIMPGTNVTACTLRDACVLRLADTVR